jgi:formylglycine-generating enzyme required for sulfatase activity
VAVKEYMPLGLALRGPDGATLVPGTDGADDVRSLADGLRAFLQEARRLAELARDGEHPNIVGVLNFFEENQTGYLVMRCLEGATLEAHRKSTGGRLAESEALPLVMALLDGLRAVHAAGIVHRDIKPQNLFLTRTGQVKLLDFGAARQAVSAGSRSVTAVLTPPYAPPEQYSTRGRQGPWTDVYAVGATLYGLLTGKLPPEAPERKDAERDPLVPPDRVSGAEVSPEVAAVVARAMTLAVPPEPGAPAATPRKGAPPTRYRDAAELQSALDAAAQAAAARRAAEAEAKGRKDERSRLETERRQAEAALAGLKAKLRETGGCPRRAPRALLAGGALLLCAALVLVAYGLSRGDREPPRADRGGDPLAVGRVAQPPAERSSAAAREPVAEPAEPAEPVVPQAAAEQTVAAAPTASGPEANPPGPTGPRGGAGRPAEKPSPGTSGTGGGSGGVQAGPAGRGPGKAHLAEPKPTEPARSKPTATPPPGPARPDPAPPAPARPEPARPSPARPDPAPPSPARPLIDWVALPAGTFDMGSDVGEDDQLPVHRVRVEAFELSRSEVTLAQYRACVAAGACSEPGRGEACNWGLSGRDAHPVNCVDWNQATQFAAWAGGRLPSEAEWEYAARSAGRAQTYPWGEDNPSCGRVVMHDGVADGCGRGATWPVCSKPGGSSAQGVCDLIGNVREWVADGWHDSYAGAPADGSAWVDGAQPYRVSRGCSWNNDGPPCRADSRLPDEPDDRIEYLGFRVARQPR